MGLTVKQKETKLRTLLHVAKNQLMMNDPEYRQLIASCSAGKVSSKNLNLKELELALKKMKAHGFVVTIKSKTNKEPLYAQDGQSKMIRGLWLELYEEGLIKDSSELALSHFIKRITGIDHYAFLNTDKASQVIECLKAWLKRKVCHE